MKKIYSAQDPLMVSSIKNVLESYGIGCVIRNTYLSSAAGEIPPIECWPELWIVDEARHARAQTILRKALAPLEAVREPCICGRCGEEAEGQFAVCWNCGAGRPNGGKF